MADRHPTGEAVSDDLEKRLRDWSESMNLYQEESDDLNNAADELARLRSENEALRESRQKTLSELQRSFIREDRARHELRIREQRKAAASSKRSRDAQTAWDEIRRQVANLRAENEALKGECERLREALTKISESGPEENEWDAVEKYHGVIELSRAALKEGAAK